MNRSPVGLKLGSAFGLLLGLMIGVGWLGLSRLDRTYEDLNRLASHASRVEVAQKAEYYANFNIKLVMQILTLGSKENLDLFEVRRAENRRTTAEVIEILKPKLDSDREIALLANIDNARLPTRRSVDHIVDLLREGKQDEARQVMITETSPLLQKYDKAWEAFVQFQNEQMEQVQNQSKANYMETQRIVVLLMSLAIILAVVIAVFATRRIVLDDRLREKTKEDIRTLNEELETKIAKRTKDLAHAVEKLESEIEIRRKSEDDLRRSEEELAIAQQIAHLGSFHQDLTNLDDIESNPLHVSDEVFRIFGYQPGEIEPLKANFIQAIHPDDRQSASQATQMAIQNKGPNSHEYRIILPDTTGRIVHAQWEVACDPATGRPARFFGTIQDITERKKAEERFYKAFNANPEPISIATISEGRYLDVNESFLRVTGYSREEVIGRSSVDLNFWAKPEDRVTFVSMLNTQGSIRDLEIPFRTKSGDVRIAVDSAEVIDVNEQKCVIAIFRDVTEQKALENLLRQTQKMEAIGQLTGGIAHDFNNLLSVIIGYSEVLEIRLPPGDPLHKVCLQIKKAGLSAASLTRQLLAFSRQQVLEPKVLALNTVVLHVEKMLQRLIGEHIDLRTKLDSSLGLVKADQSQIEQVIINLAVNARDAMPQGGTLIIETANVYLDEEYARRHTVHGTGPYVLLTIADTGIGMDAQTQSHIFEPFFTTKEVGKGTGLGLATVYGIVRQSGGHIWVYSELGHGTIFKIYLPQTEQGVRTEKSNTDFINLKRNSETILLVEDSEPVRELTRGLLIDSGYTVLEADLPHKAIEIARTHKGHIHLLLTDMVMPKMNGRALAEKVLEMRPDMKVLYTSGYTTFSQSSLLDSDLVLLVKPFTKDSLLQKLRELLTPDSELTTS